MRRCDYCNTELKDEDIKYLSNARGFGYYIVCSNCGKEIAILEIEERGL